MITVLQAFGLSTNSVVEPITSGIINSTWKVKSEKGNYILQRINDLVFVNPKDIHENIAAIALYLKKNYQHYLFPAPILSLEGSELVHILGKGYYRLFPFIVEPILLMLLRILNRHLKRQNSLEDLPLI
jgi:Ser/Thr protein kinase RdoA (MazF antagonist)